MKIRLRCCFWTARKIPGVISVLSRAYSSERNIILIIEQNITGFPNRIRRVIPPIVSALKQNDANKLCETLSLLEKTYRNKYMILLLEWIWSIYCIEKRGGSDQIHSIPALRIKKNPRIRLFYIFLLTGLVLFFIILYITAVYWIFYGFLLSGIVSAVFYYPEYKKFIYFKKKEREREFLHILLLTVLSTGQTKYSEILFLIYSRTYFCREELKKWIKIKEKKKERHPFYHILSSLSCQPDGDILKM